MCPNCQSSIFTLHKLTGDFQDGIVACKFCEEVVASFNLEEDVEPNKNARLIFESSLSN